MRARTLLRLARHASTLLIALGAGACSSSYGPAVTNPAQYALPTMGSGGYAYAYGAAWPGATVPNGMMRVGPDTTGTYGDISFLHFSGYWAGDNGVMQFTHLHLHGTGAQDYGVLGILPVTAYDPTKVKASDYSSTFKRVSQIATPGYYALTLDQGPIKAEFTATTHASHERFTYPSGASTGTVIIDLTPHLGGTVSDSSVTLASTQNGVQGSLTTQGGMSGGFQLYFAIQFKNAWTTQQVWSSTALAASVSSASGAGVGMALTFDVSNGQPVEAQVGVSLVSLAGAIANLQAELPAWDFAGTQAAAVSQWNQRLGSLQVYGGTETQRQVFYSALHHAFVMPGVYSDVDGSFNYQGVSKANGYLFLNDFSGWDILRSLAPLYVLVAPDVALNEVQSLYAMAQATGSFPKWPLACSDSGSMIGSAADVILGDAYVKGIQPSISADAYQRLRDAALDATMPSGEARGGRGDDPNFVNDYIANGGNNNAPVNYVTYPTSASVSMSCEFSHEDFALANFAQALGNTSDAQTLMARASGWQSLYDSSTGFLRAHTPTGQIADDGFMANDFGFEPEYDEADAYQTMFCAQNDIATLEKLWGGSTALVTGMSTLFQETETEHAADVQMAATAGNEDDPDQLAVNLPPVYYFAGNEPDINYVYMFAQAGRPDLTQQWVPWVRDTYFTAQPNGLPGNDDGGTMTAWYVFSALGFYPISGSDQYVLGSPEFPRVDIKVGKGAFSVEANGVSSENIYIQSATLNGKPLPRRFSTTRTSRRGARSCFRWDRSRARGDRAAERSPELKRGGPASQGRGIAVAGVRCPMHIVAAERRPNHGRRLRHGCLDPLYPCAPPAQCDDTTRTCTMLCATACESGQYCDAPSGQCLAGCEDLAYPCMFGDVCDDTTHSCRPVPCGACEPGYYCDQTTDGQCTPGCEDPMYPCPEGALCDDSTNECQSTGTQCPVCCRVGTCCNIATFGECLAGCLDPLYPCPGDGGACDNATNTCGPG